MFVDRAGFIAGSFFVWFVIADLPGYARKEVCYLYSERKNGRFAFVSKIFCKLQGFE